MNKEKKFVEMASVDKARSVAGWLDDKQGERITLIDVSGLSSVTDMILVVSARGVKHAQALASHVLDKAAEENMEFLSMEGHKTGEWVLIDLNDVLVHVFLDDLREFYNIEGMWTEAPRVGLQA
ncbi:ribosome silencing factor [Pseudodesulfovibrio thermohalotolerans]|uniref:ribosome silencing factor n=1 Tax=Pseudodesulfovibrio thermohalotolerans TaxID=2880651 RepID=UPI0022B9EFE9|nr:ribosome silencing factor [Pseudodesulfovibrio thermohalotolerans]WFS64103.1 ribosome silencing factor [Pseudodesulfovibrio thermohalotolerans]